MALPIAVFGKKKRGKTRLIENLIKEFNKRGLKVGVAKHVHHEDFTIDTPGKDSWRFSQAGAKRILIVSPKEVVRIDKDGNKDILSNFKDFDIVLMEGFYDEFSKDERILKIIVGRDEEDISDLLSGCKGKVYSFIKEENLEELIKILLSQLSPKLP